MNHHKQISPGRSNPRLLSAMATFSFLFTFVCFFPNPALPIGGSTGLQAGQILALLSLPMFLVLGLPKRQALALLLLTLPLLSSGFLAVLTGRAISSDVAVKFMIATVLTFVALVPVGEVVNRRHIVPLLSGAASAIVLHVLIGAYQMYWFAQDVFPLPGLYLNPSFRSSIATHPEIWAQYVKRPFGLFPEPSAMAASIGPWIVLFVGLLMYSRFRYRFAYGTRTLLALAAVGGIGLIIASSSGYTVWLLVSLLLVGSPLLKDRILHLHRPGSLFALVGLVLVCAVVAALSVTYLSSRLDVQGGSQPDVQGNSSWSARLASIVYGLSYLGMSLSNLLLGAGPGQSYLVLQSSGTLPVFGGGLGDLPVTAVWSMVVSYLQEVGLLGGIALVAVLFLVLRAIALSSACLVGSGCLLAWLAGVVFTTSYLPLLPIWLFLGMLLGWDRLFEAPRSSNRLGSDLDIPPTRSKVRA